MMKAGHTELVWQTDLHSSFAEPTGELKYLHSHWFILGVPHLIL